MRSPGGLGAMPGGGGVGVYVSDTREHDFFFPRVFLLKAKMRKYDEAYEAIDFTVTYTGMFTVSTNDDKIIQIN